MKSVSTNFAIYETASLAQAVGVKRLPPPPHHHPLSGQALGKVKPKMQTKSFYLNKIDNEKSGTFLIRIWFLYFLIFLIKLSAKPIFSTPKNANV